MLFCILTTIKYSIFQGGFTTNLAPGKIVGKLLNFFDSTAHRVVGGLPPPAPSASQGSVPDSHHQLVAPRVSGSQSTMTMSSLISSASTEPISEWAADGNKMTMHNRSVSEPDFGRSPIQVCYLLQVEILDLNCLMFMLIISRLLTGLW